MKTIINIIISLIMSNLAFCQTSTYSLVDQGYGFNHSFGVYYKDTYNDFNKFVGIWKFQSGNRSLTIVLNKKVMYNDVEDGSYIDIVVGEYKYVNENGVEIINTLSNLNALSPYDNNISGLLILDKNLAVEDRKIKLDFRDPDREYLNRKIIVKHIPAFNGAPEKIQLEWTGDMSIIPDDASPTTLRVPEENYILVKQP